jgi:ankyrin repeat protein
MQQYSRSTVLILVVLMVALINEQVSADTAIKDPQKALTIAAQQGNVIAVRAALKAGADVNKKYEHGYCLTPLMYATLVGHREIVEELLAMGADIDAKDDDYERTALMQAILLGHEEIVTLLIDNRADVNAQDNYGWSPLMMLFLAEAGILPLLLEDGSVSYTNYIMRALLAAGADVNAEDEKDETVLTKAQRYGNGEMIELLISVGAKVDFGARIPGKDFNMIPLSYINISTLIMIL